MESLAIIMTQELKQRVMSHATNHKKSMNQWVLDLIKKELDAEITEDQNTDNIVVMVSIIDRNSIYRRKFTMEAKKLSTWIETNQNSFKEKGYKNQLIELVSNKIETFKGNICSEIRRKGDI